jgi:hypothetical protein
MALSEPKDPGFALGGSTILTQSERWILAEAARPSGFTPNANSAKELAVSLELRGLVRQSDNYPVWFITDAGRSAAAVR